MLVRWKERPMPRRQRSCGGMPVTSRSLNRTLPASGLKWPVMRLKSVVLPAPLGPMMAQIEPRCTVRLTPATAKKPSKLLRRSRTSSTGHSPRDAPSQAERRARDAAREDEEQHDEDDPEDERPVLRVGDDLLVQPEEDQGAQSRAEEGAHAAQERHDQHLGGLGPVGEVGEDAAVEDAEERAGKPGEHAGQHEGRKLVPAHVDTDELRALRVLADGGEHAAEGRAHDAAHEPEAARDQQQGQEVEVIGRAVAAQERQRPRRALDPAEVRVGDLWHALLASGDLVHLKQIAHTIWANASVSMAK